MPGSPPIGVNCNCKRNNQIKLGHFRNGHPIVKGSIDVRLKEETLLCVDLTPVWMRIRLRFQQKQRVKEERVKKDIDLGR